MCFAHDMPCGVRCPSGVMGLRPDKQQFENKTAPFIDTFPLFLHYAQISALKFVNFLKILNSALYKFTLVWYNDRA